MSLFLLLARHSNGADTHWVQASLTVWLYPDLMSELETAIKANLVTYYQMMLKNTYLGVNRPCQRQSAVATKVGFNFGRLDLGVAPGSKTKNGPRKSLPTAFPPLRRGRTCKVLARTRMRTRRTAQVQGKKLASMKVLGLDTHLCHVDLDLSSGRVG